MSPLKFKLTLLLLTVFCLSSVQADSLVLNGSAVYSHLNRDLYLGGLYLPSQSDDPDYIASVSTTKRMQMVVLVSSWSPRRWSQIWQNNIAINNDSFSANESVQQALMTFTSFPRQDIRAGDEIVIDYQANGNSRVLLNGDLVLEAPGTEFFNYMVNTWIGKLPPTREFRQNILGQENTNESQKETLLSHRIQRAGLFSGWIATEKAALKAEQDRIEQARIAAEQQQQRQRNAEAARQAELNRQAELKRQQELAQQQELRAKESIQPTAEEKRLAQQRAEQQRQQQAQAAAAQAKKLKSQGQTNTAKALEDEQLYHLNMLQWQLQRQLQAAVSYPAWAKQFGQEGLVELDLQVNRQQEVSKLQARNDGASDLLVNEVKRAVAVAAAKTTIPADLAGDSWPVSVSYLFSLQNKPQPEVAMPKAPTSLQKAKAPVSSKELEAEYVQAELERIAANVQYPPGARILKKQGKVIVEFDISKEGKVLEIREVESSRHRELNQALQAAVKGSEPYPPLPLALKKEKLTLTLDYDFKL